MSYIIGASSMLIVGILDDMYDVKVRVRLLVQLISAIVIVARSGIYFDYLGQIDGLGSISLGGVGMAITVLFFMTNINSYNMVDGVDGLLGMLSLISTITLAIFISAIGFLGEYFKLSDFMMLLSFLFIMVSFTCYFVHTSKFNKQ
ncbi:MAG: hypothetical protein HRU28_03605 [Rhizobiales bacterium]|nr:hypothetical protein [Hyphomicrobiales bacterium]